MILVPNSLEAGYFVLAFLVAWSLIALWCFMDTAGKPGCGESTVWNGLGFILGLIGIVLM